MPNPLSCNSLQGWLNRDVPGAPLWCLARSLLACRTGCAAERAGRGRGRAVMLCAAGAVTNRIPYYFTRVFPLTPPPHARTHRPTVATLVHPPNCTHSRQDYAFLFFCIAIVSRNAMFAHVSTTLTNLQHEPKRHECPRIRCLCTTCALLPYGRMRNHHRITLAVSLLRLSQS